MIASAGRGVAATLLLVSLGLAAGATWPLWQDPANRLPGNADVYLKTWAVAWVARQLVRAPGEVFEANMFFPYRSSLLFDDSALPLGAMAIPVRALGGSPELAFNLLLLASFPLAAIGAYAFARDLGSSRGGAFLAGLAFAFWTYRWDHVVHLQSLWVAWLPLALLFLRRTLRGEGWASALGLCVTVLLQVLTSGYYALLTAVALVVVGLGSIREGRRPARGGVAALALLGSFLLAAPELLARREFMKQYSFSRTEREAVHWSAGPGSYLDPGIYAALPHGRLLHGLFESGEPLFGGSAVLVLAGLAAWRGRGETATRLAIALAVVGIVLSFGPKWRLGGLSLPGPYALLRIIPGGDLLRTPSRFGVLAQLGLGTLAALGLTRLSARFPERWRAPAIAGLIAFSAAEAHPSGLAPLFKPSPPVPPSAAWLASAPRGAVLELPWEGPNQAALYLLWSTRHWQPLVNGYASFEPPGNLGLGLLGQRWPSGYTSRVFRACGIRYVVVHSDRLSPRRREWLLASGSLPEGVSLAANLGPDFIHVIESQGPRARAECGVGGGP